MKGANESVVCFCLLLLLYRVARSHRTPLTTIKGPLHLTREKSHSICHRVRPNLTHSALVWPHRSEWSYTWETFAHRCHFHTPLRWQIFMESSYASWRMAPGIIITCTLEIRQLLCHLLEMFASPAASEIIYFFGLLRCVWATEHCGKNELMSYDMFQHVGKDQDRTVCYDTLVVAHLKNYASLLSSSLSISFKLTDFHKHCAPQFLRAWFD